MGFTINDSVDHGNIGQAITGTYVTCFGAVKIGKETRLVEEVETEVYVASTTMFYYFDKAARTTGKKWLKRLDISADLESATSDAFAAVYVAAKASYASTTDDL